MLGPVNGRKRPLFGFGAAGATGERPGNHPHEVMRVNELPNELPTSFRWAGPRSVGTWRPEKARIRDLAAENGPRANPERLAIGPVNGRKTPLSGFGAAEANGGANWEPCARRCACGRSRSSSRTNFRWLARAVSGLERSAVGGVAGGHLCPHASAGRIEAVSRVRKLALICPTLFFVQVSARPSEGRVRPGTA